MLLRTHEQVFFYILWCYKTWPVDEKHFVWELIFFMTNFSSSIQPGANCAENLRPPCKIDKIKIKNMS